MRSPVLLPSIRACVPLSFPFGLGRGGGAWSCDVSEEGLKAAVAGITESCDLPLPEPAQVLGHFDDLKSKVFGLTAPKASALLKTRHQGCASAFLF